MTGRRRPPSALTNVPKQAVRVAPPPQRPNDTSRRLAFGLGGALVVLILLTLVVLGIGPFSRSGPSPTPRTGVGSPSPSGGPGSPGASASPTDATREPTSTATASASPSSSPTPQPSSPRPSSAAPSATPAPTTNTPFLGAKVSGSINQQTRGFFVRTLLTQAQLQRYTVTKQGAAKAGSALGDFPSFAASKGRAVMWQSWRGTKAVRQISDVRLAFPTSEDATAFIKTFGDEVASSAGLSDAGPVKIGEQTRALRSDATDAAGVHTVRIVYLFRRGDIVGVNASVSVGTNSVGLRNRATVIAQRAGLDLDEALGITPGQ